MKLTETPITTANRNALEPLRVILPGKEGEHRGSCASCGQHLWSEGGYRVPGLQGLFCSLLCMECAIAKKTGHTKKIPDAPIGNGARLLAYLKTEALQVYAKLIDGAAERASACSESRAASPSRLTSVPV